MIRSIRNLVREWDGNFDGYSLVNARVDFDCRGEKERES